MFTSPRSRTVQPFFNILSMLALAGTARAMHRGPLFTPDDPAAGGGGGGGDAGNKGDENDPLKKAQADLAAAQARIKALEGEKAQSEARISELSDKAKTAALSEAERAELKKLKDEKDKAEEDRKKAAGQFDLLAKEAAEKAEKREQELQAEIAKRDSVLAEERKLSKLRELIPKFTGADSSDVINALFRDSVSVDKDGKFVVKGKDGQPPRHPKTTLPMTLEEFVEHEINSRPYFKAVKPLGGSGSESQGGGTAPNGKYTAEDLRKMTPEEYKKKRKEILASVGSD